MPTTTETRMTKEYGIILPESLNVGGGSGGVGLVEYATPTDYTPVAKERDIIIAPIEFSTSLAGPALKYTNVNGIKIIAGTPGVIEEIVVSPTQYMIAIVGKIQSAYIELSPVANASLGSKGVYITDTNDANEINITLEELAVESMERLRNGIITVRKTGIFALSNSDKNNAVMGSRLISKTYSYKGKIYVIPA